MHTTQCRRLQSKWFVAVAAAAAGAVFAVVVLVDVCRSFSSTVRLTVDILILFEQSSRK